MASRKELKRRDELIALCRTGNAKKVFGILKHEAQNDTLLNMKNKDGTTALHEACCFGRTDCIKLLLKYGAGINIRDLRGFSPIHCAVYNNHQEAVEILLKWMPRVSSNPKCDVDEPSSYYETPLHIACMRGHYRLAQYLVECGANPQKRDKDRNTSLHFACGGDSGKLVHWLMTELELAAWMDETNQSGQSPAHRAALLGCVSSMSVLVHHKADLSLQDRAGHTPSDLARILNNTDCLSIARGESQPNPLPELRGVAIPKRGSKGSLSLLSVRSADSLQSDEQRRGSGLSLGDEQRRGSGMFLGDEQRRGSGMFLGDEQRRGSGLLFQTQHSHTSADSQSSPSSLKRSGSITGRHRPRNIQIPSSLPEGGGAGPGEEPLVYASKEASDQIKRGIKRQNSRSKGDMYKLLYDKTAYEPPQEIMFVQPHHSDTLTHDKRETFSSDHDLKLTVSKSYWIEGRMKQPTLDVCLSTAMHFNRSFPAGFVIVSPVCFVSCKATAQHPPLVTISLPHALQYPEQERNKICILYMNTVDPNLSVDSPIGVPAERTLTPLPGDPIKEIASSFVSFRMQLDCPTLFAVGVRTDEKNPAPLELKCSLYVTYPILDGNTTISAFEVMTYIGMSLRTVDTAIAAHTSQRNERYSKFNFLLKSEDLEVQAELKNKPEHWTIDALTQGKIKFSQITLSRSVHDCHNFSHDSTYPPSEHFFIEPHSAVGAVRCQISLAGSNKFFLKQLVIPYRGASKEPTPDPTPPSSHPGSLTGLHQPASQTGSVTGLHQPASQPGSLTGLHQPASQTGSVTGLHQPASQPGSVTALHQPGSQTSSLTGLHVPSVYINGTTSQSIV